MPAGLATTLGAPGLYWDHQPQPRTLTGVRMDVCAFLGVAPRGPVREKVLDPIERNCLPDRRVTRQLRRTVPVVVESFDQYRELFGGFEGPGLLPYAVASFFEQGGRRAYVARIVHRYPPPASAPECTAHGVLAGAVHSGGIAIELHARSEGTWGNSLRAGMKFATTPLSATLLERNSVTLDSSATIAAGELLRFTLDDESEELAFVTHIAETRDLQAPTSRWIAALDRTLTRNPVVAEIVTASLSIDDGDGRSEAFTDQGLSPEHPRWLGATLSYDSRLVRPDESWIATIITPDPKRKGEVFKGGVDDFASIVPDDFFDPSWTPGDDEPGDGIASLVHLRDLSSVAIPDLYSPGPLAPVEPAVDPGSLAGPEFRRCVEVGPSPIHPVVGTVDLAGLRLDPLSAWRTIAGLQKRVVDFADIQRSWVVLLDVPPGLKPRQILEWRGTFSSAWAAAYHPWLRVARRDDLRDALIRVPPSAIAAGIIARRELKLGVPAGPANELAAQVVDVAEAVSPVQHDLLHPEGINVFLRERDGVRLSAARTLSRDSAWRQLSVRRLITMICRTLEREMQWAVFEPNGRQLRGELRLLLRTFLRRLFVQGAFRGSTESEAFFVTCDETNNPSRAIDAGQVLAEIGVAPAEPLEFIVIQLSTGSDGTLLLRET